jgi:hypothetical protein
MGWRKDNAIKRVRCLGYGGMAQDFITDEQHINDHELGGIGEGTGLELRLRYKGRGAETGAPLRGGLYVTVTSPIEAQNFLGRIDPQALSNQRLISDAISNTLVLITLGVVVIGAALLNALVRYWRKRDRAG